MSPSQFTGIDKSLGRFLFGEARAYTNQKIVDKQEAIERSQLFEPLPQHSRTTNSGCRCSTCFPAATPTRWWRWYAEQKRPPLQRTLSSGGRIRRRSWTHGWWLFSSPLSTACRRTAGPVLIMRRARAFPPAYSPSTSGNMERTWRSWTPFSRVSWER